MQSWMSNPHLNIEEHFECTAEHRSRSYTLVNAKLNVQSTSKHWGTYHFWIQSWTSISHRCFAFSWSRCHEGENTKTRNHDARMRNNDARSRTYDARTRLIRCEVAKVRCENVILISRCRIVLSRSRIGFRGFVVSLNWGRDHENAKTRCENAKQWCEVAGSKL
jgi:hypothetical protein